MAARFGATIVPFGTVGEDDIADILFDFNDLAEIPYFIEYVRELQRGSVKFRDEISGEVASRDIAPPLILPKLPGRFYYLFGKPISTKGMENMLKDREAANKLYLQIKSEVENNMGYLLKKRLRNRLAWMQNYQTYATGTSTAPTYLPALQFTNKDPKGNVHEFNLIDGGVCANNPKFDAVSRYGIEGGGLSFFSDIALLLIDEVHLLNDPHRAALEAIVSRIKIVSCNPKMKLNPLAQVHLVAVSATIPNIEDLAEWIKVPEEGIKR
ncbi:acyltransferase-like protein At1g54570, chloroplastic [Arachis ipaensis]|uniref:acyltransferase-like protein At1g54570, chloroplastic n=1 Tax=Arachis ipaensis TaxID=130454 RepID=UPI000A2B2949|nr:acyltransferase-like protein At1g54570, chloroplastic [Arachis ipaensis]